MNKETSKYIEEFKNTDDQDKKKELKQKIASLLLSDSSLIKKLTLKKLLTLKNQQ